PSPTPHADRRRAFGLGLELADGRLDRLAGDPAAVEVGADRRVAVPPLGEAPRPRARRALVVEQAGAPKRLDRSVAVRGCDVSAAKALLELAGGEIAMPQRPGRGPERLVPAELAPQH